MTIRIAYLPLALGAAALACAAAAGADEAPQRPPRPKARLYTNADLERVHPFAAETGVRSVPAVSAGDVAPAAAREARPRGRGEAYWRSEAARVRERLRALEAQADELRARIAEQASRSEVFGRKRSASGASATASLRASLAAVEKRARLTQDDLEERARRDGALPGWLR